MDEFDRYRSEMNEKLLGSNHLGIKRFFALDTQAYEDGALDKRTKELLGLVAEGKPIKAIAVTRKVPPDDRREW